MEKAIRRDSLTEIGILISIKRDGNIMIYNKNVPEKRCEKEKERRMRILVVDDEVNVVMGLDMGADDYVTKPFRIRELMSRIKSVLRRYERRDGGSLLERQA